MAISAGQEGPIWAEDNGIDCPPCKTCTSCPDATSQSRIITSTTQAKNTLSGLTCLGGSEEPFFGQVSGELFVVRHDGTKWYSLCAFFCR